MSQAQFLDELKNERLMIIWKGKMKYKRKPDMLQQLVTCNICKTKCLQLFKTCKRRLTKYTISQAIYTMTERSKYPSDERLMQVCYNALLNANGKEFQNKMKNIGWRRFFHKNVCSLRVKNAIHDEFTDLVKPKTENLRKPVDSNNSSYTYLNLIIDNAFPDFNTEKNSIAFGMVVALNYLDPSKGIKLVQSEVVKWMDYFLEKIKV
ncbi:unnamed protein product [Rhizophagus irregularis]|nr:unnamed protein product [Rhizophagus irregularis]